MTLQQANDALVFAYDYRPLVPFEVISRLQQGAVDDILGREVDDDPAVSDPDDYRGYIILYMMDDNAGEYALTFIEDESLSEGDEYEFGTDAVFFSTEANLLEVDINGGDGDDDETPTPEDETPTPEDETPTPEDGTPTPEEGTPTPEEGTPTPEPGGGNGGEGGGNGGAGDGGGG